jgi:transcriptional regulator of acetoin/glycerol metabolism
MATASTPDIRRRLRSLGKRRARMEREDEVLTKDIQQALEDAEGLLSVTEQAELLGLHRTTLYRVYK